MKKAAVILSLMVALIMGGQVAAQNAEIVVTEQHSIFKGVFLEVWGRLKALNPSIKQSARSNATYTAGIRGAEATDTLLQPYWKDDLTQDAQFQQELSQYSLAQQQMDEGDMAAAVASFDKFLSDHAGSLLRPNAMFAKSLCLAGMGDANAAKSSLQVFIEENPDHPLVGDAEQVVAAL